MTNNKPSSGECGGVKDLCQQCKNIIPANFCVQPFSIDGRKRFFHLGCFEVWYETNISVLRVRHGKQSFVTIEPYTPVGDEEVTLEWETMKQGKFHTLKEFTGF